MNTLDDNFRKAISRLGQILCCDEKLFCFTGYSINIRFCKAKPARMDIWFYQGVVKLQNGLSFLITTEPHFHNPEINNHFTMVDIIDNWTDLVAKKNPKAVAVMDSYYLSHEATFRIKEKESFVIAAINHGRFPEFARLLNKDKRGPGMMASAFNDETGEALTFYHSQNKRVGRKVVYSTAFELKKKKAGVIHPNFLRVQSHVHCVRQIQLCHV